MSSNWTVLLDGTSLPDRSLIGGKAWSIARMRGMDLPVPPAFVITTQACNAYLAQGDFPEGLEAEIEAGLQWLDAATGRSFGGMDRPLLLSVRSGAAISMPGMMDTVLNLGIDDAAEAALAAESGLPDFARDTHRRFLELYASIVLKNPVELDHEAMPADWRGQVDVPATPRECLTGAVRAVFDSWNTRRAKKYREHNNIPHDMGTAVTIQAMVFGNLDERSGTGVLFSRNPLTGEALPYGEYLPRAQGEDVVSGKFTPLALDAMHDCEPAAHATLLDASARLEREHRDMQDIEFTVQSGTLYLLQARSAKRAPDAAVRAAVEMVGEGLIDIDQALARVSPEQVRALLLPRLGGEVQDAAVVAQGEGACPGVACGTVVTDPDEAERRAAAGEAVILVRATTSPDDIHGMIAAKAVVTEQGGSTSHAAVVSRALGRPCVVGVGDGNGPQLGALVTVDGETGRVYAGELPVEMPDEAKDARLTQLIEWARDRSPVRVLRPADAAGLDGVVDIDALWSGGEPDELPALLHGAAAARGATLANPDTARLARAQGVRTIVTEPVLPALLALLGEAA
ncbi:pyruvate, phosphate dikinase [Sphingobium lactosutens]|uniref:pyruvate, phosphate dikinase n=1 Tax=Sphingobium lactosutens TaxID=522773 RepID=UPI0015BA3B74|nr:pyruvate, phosphate dikinase [Sphingobium lactosutens]NWK94426.1 pyruvate, phosphate dikinase [Sphingobium lactosutens]